MLKILIKNDKKKWHLRILFSQGGILEIKFHASGNEVKYTRHLCHINFLLFKYNSNQINPHTIQPKIQIQYLDRINKEFNS